MVMSIAEIVGLTSEIPKVPLEDAVKVGLGVLTFYEERGIEPGLGDLMFLSGPPTELIIYDEPLAKSA